VIVSEKDDEVKTDVCFEAKEIKIKLSGDGACWLRDVVRECIEPLRMAIRRFSQVKETK
jgi:hypothetical protein